VIIRQIPHPEPLFQHLFDPLRGYLFVASLEWGNEDSWCQRPYRYPEQAGKAAQWLTNAAQLGLESYYSAHLFRTRHNRQSTNAHEHVMALWLDLDGGEYPENGPQPTVRVRTSPGKWHLYFRLRAPIGAEHAQDLNRRLCAFAGGDPTGVPLSSVLRPPGTARYKGARPELVVGCTTGVPSWQPDVLEQALPVLEQEVRDRRQPYEGPALELGPFLRHVEVLGEAPDGLGVKWRVICPWLEEHSHGDRTGTYIGKIAGGGAWFRCRHEHCHRRTWSDFKNEVRRRAKTISIHRGSRKGARVKEVRVRRG
jgi:RepB DNA-primase from phage plasmid